MTFSAQARAVFMRDFGKRVSNLASSTIAQSAILTMALGSIIAFSLFVFYEQIPILSEQQNAVFTSLLVKTFSLMVLIIGVVSWLFTSARMSNRRALNELREQTNALALEVEAHKKTSKSYRLAIKSSESANQAKSRYLAGLSHELRTPLNILLGYAQLLSKDNTLSNETRHSINTMKRNGEHLANLIEGVLEVSKIEAGRLTVHRDHVSIRSFLEQLVNMFQLQARAKGLSFTYDFPAHLPDLVVTDKRRLRQILINLISNAIKFTQQGTVNFKLVYRNQVGHFIVSDSGEGISEEDQKVIFRPFERVESSQTKSLGTGLGLTISRALSELMGGDISVQSALQQGSVFTLKLMLPSVNAVQREKVAKKNIQGYEGPIKTVLVVDDEESQRELIHDILYPVGFNVELADSTCSAMSALTHMSIDIVLLDLNMPDVNGWQAAKQMRKSGFTGPIIIVSANVRDLEVSNRAEGHHNDYLVKPFSINALLENVGLWLKLNWVYQSGQIVTPTNIANLSSKPKAGIYQYKALKALAEVGYLSGFTNELKKINQAYELPKNGFASLMADARECQFQTILQTLNTQIEMLKDSVE